MKKLALFIFFSVLIPSLLFGQKFKEYYFEVDISTLSGADTSIVQSLPAAGPIEVFLDSSTYTGSGGTLDIQGTPTDSTIAVSITHADLPYTITTDAHRFVKEYFASRRIVFKITKNSFTAGTVRLYLTVKYL